MSTVKVEKVKRKSKKDEERVVVVEEKVIVKEKKPRKSKVIKAVDEVKIEDTKVVKAVDEVKIEDKKVLKVVEKESMKSSKLQFPPLPNVLFQYDFSPENAHLICKLFQTLKNVLPESFSLEFVKGKCAIFLRILSNSSNVISVTLGKSLFEQNSLVLPQHDEILTFGRALFLSCVNDKSHKRSMTWSLGHESHTESFPFKLHYNREKKQGIREFGIATDNLEDAHDENQMDITTITGVFDFVAEMEFSVSVFRSILQDVGLNEKAEWNTPFCSVTITKNQVEFSTYNDVVDTKKCRKRFSHISSEDMDDGVWIKYCIPNSVMLVFETKHLFQYVLDLPGVDTFNIRVTTGAIFTTYEISKDSAVRLVLAAKCMD